jgi:peptidyl-dipeptidase Dcp
MRSRALLITTSAGFALAASVAGCATTGSMQMEPMDSPTITANNPLLAEWQGPHGGVPPFDLIRVEHFEPALEAAMAANLAEVERIASDPSPPSFENMFAALERAGATLSRVLPLYSVWQGTLNTPDFQAVEREMAPRLAAYWDRIRQNEVLFHRIEAVYESPEKERLTPEQQRLTWRYHTDFVRAGARLDPASKARLSEINQRLAALFTRFNQNVLADESDQFLVIRDEDGLAGLPESVRDAAADEAADRGLSGAWVIANTRSAIEPFLVHSDRRDLREEAWRMFVRRGDLSGENDNNGSIVEILALRHERARLLSFPTHAHWRLEHTMAGTPERALELLEAVWPSSVARVREEVADMQVIADQEGSGISIEPWDYRYYAEKVRAKRYDLSDDEVKPYLQLDRLRDGMFWVGGELFGFDFAAVDVPVYHPDVRVWEVTERDSGRYVGLFYFDPYARPGKRSGAWMSTYRRQQRVDAEIPPIVSNNSNFVRSRPGEPTLISWGDARTLFHEFGHALHGLASNATYPTLSGTSVARDYVEFPSQLLEHWLSTPEVLERFAVHYRTGEPIPRELVQRIERAANFNQGFRTVEFLASALVDMELHLSVADQAVDPATFERETLTALGMPDEIVMRHRMPHFLHIFGSDSYSAGYYSYLWSDVITADAFEAFLEGGGPYDPEIAARLFAHVLSAGDTVDPAEGYRAFRGRDPEVGALMRKRGFTSDEQTEEQSGWQDSQEEDRNGSDFSRDQDGRRR